MKKISILLFLAILCAGCKNLSYNPSYTRPVTMNVTPRYQGKLLVYMTPDEDKYIFHGHPKSLTGIAWDLKVPLGKMAKEMSGDIYSAQPHQIFTQPGFIETYITGTFEGWTGNSVWIMDNEQVWQEVQYGYHYHYAYHPKVIIFKSKWGLVHARGRG